MASREELLRTLTRLGVAQAKDLAKELGVSQPTISRLIKDAGESVCKMGQTRATRYARTREIRGLGTRLPIHRISETGKIESFGELYLLEGGRHWLNLAAGRHWINILSGSNTLFPGLPPFAAHMSPQGYIGRTFSRRYHHLGLPTQLPNWNDDHRLIALAHHGEDCVGNLIIGEKSLDQWIANPLKSIDRTSYPDHARRSDQEQPGSSAGGEQPKFLTYSGGRHVLVKFASSDDEAIARRWRDLLVCESLALKVIREAGIEAATAHWFDEGGYRFLEVERFDRIGERGRRGMISLRALDDEYIGHTGPGASWTSAALKLEEKGIINSEDARHIRWLDLFGQLTGNSDRHFGNLSFLETIEGRLRLAPAYDMLPMTFVPSATGVIDRPFEPAPPTSKNLDVWPNAAEYAHTFWTHVIDCAAISDDFRSLARQSRKALELLQERIAPVMGGP